MPLNRPALSLGSGPRGVQDARRWVIAALTEIGRADIVECAEMGTSELVTNALLHGAPPIQVRVRGTQEHPRVEVRDASTEVPEMPTPMSEVDLEDEDLLLTFGRGLSIVARASDAWGVEVEDDGKVVWFAPAREFSEDDGHEGQVTGIQHATPDLDPESQADLMECRLDGVPVRSYVAFQNHFRELRREVRLLALAHESDYPLAKDLSDLFATLEKPLQLGVGNPAIAQAQESGAPTVDLRVVIDRGAARRVDRFVELLDLTDAFCREERMLSLARTPEQRSFQTWFLGEFVRQSHDQAARPWSVASPHGERRTSVS